MFAFIYEGVPNWAAADGVVTLFPQSGPQIEVRLDEPNNRARICAIAQLTNARGELQVSRQVRYINGVQDALDRAYGSACGGHRVASSPSAGAGLVGVMPWC